LSANGSGAVDSTRIFLRPIASPFPLGLSGLATASLLVAGSELGWFGSSDRVLVALVLIAFTFPLQFLASIFGFLGRDTSAATSFGVQAAMWLVVGLDRLITAPGSASPALGVLLCAAAAWVALGALGAAMGKLVPALILLMAASRFLLTGLHELTAGVGVEHAAGVIGLVLVALCGYAILALETESLQRRTVLPILRRGSGRAAMTAALEDQARRLEHEPGVREQL
jgi:succinate-acetate transporter protein